VLIKTKEIKLILVKVREHSGIVGNELADELAKGGARGNMEFSEIDRNSLGNLRFIPVWNSNSIEQKIRKFIKNVNSIRQQSLWSTNRNIRNYKFSGSYRTEAAFLNIDETRDFRCGNWNTHKFWIMKVKLLNNLFPTLTVMQERYPQIINYNKCLFCHTEQETFDHLITCNKLEDIWKTIIKDSINNTKTKTKKLLDIDLSTEYINRTLNAKRKNTQTANGNALINLLRGFTPTFLTEGWIKVCKSVNKVYGIVKELIGNIQKTFHDNIWKVRCKLLKEWERVNGRNFKKEIYCQSTDKTSKKVYTLNTNPDDHIVVLDDDAKNFQARNSNLNSVIVLNGREKQEWGWDISRDIIERNITYREVDNWLYKRIKDFTKVKKSQNNEVHII